MKFGTPGFLLKNKDQNQVLVWKSSPNLALIIIVDNATTSERVVQIGPL